MFRIMLKSKIYYATVSEAKLYYKGSITIDKDLIEAAGLVAGERVDVLNQTNGARLRTYVIEGKRGSGVICLNGPAARSGYRGDKLVILSYALYGEDEIKNLKAKFVELDEQNKIAHTSLGR
ncbi:MAG: aspartate 1-decarboxylase [Candidatus Omnitrophota bacterium]